MLPVLRSRQSTILVELLALLLILFAIGLQVSPSFAGGGYSTIQNQGSDLPQQVVVNFTGPGVTCSDNIIDTRTDCSIPGGLASAYYQTVQEEGSALPQELSLNFIGAALTAADDNPGNRTNITLSASPDSVSVVGTGRLINTTGCISGGGDLTSDLTISSNTCVASVGGTSPVVSSGGTTPTISCPTCLVSVTVDSPLSGAGTGVSHLTCPTCVTNVTGTGPIVSSGGTTPDISCVDCLTQAYVVIQDEDLALANRYILNFEGGGVSCADDTTKTTCTIANVGTVTNVSATSPITSSGGATPNIACATCVTDVTGGVGVDSTGGTTPDVTFDATELTNLTWSAGGSASIVWTYNVSGTDTVVTYGSGVVNVSTGTLQQGGTDVVLESRTISTTSPLGGGGDLQNNLTLTCTGCLTQAYVTIQEDGSGLTQRSTLNFVGASVTCADDTTRTTCTFTSAGTVTDVTATSPVTSSGGATPDIACPTCVTSVTGGAGVDSSGGTTPDITFDSTELTNLTFSAGGSATLVWDFNLSAGDPQLTLGSGVFNVSSGTLQQGGVNVCLASATCTGYVNTSRTLTGGIGIAAIGDLSADRTITFDATELGNLTFGAAADASVTWTYSLSGATDPVWTIGNNSMDLSTGVLKQGGTAVCIASAACTGYVATSLTLTTAAGLSGGGDLSANRSFATDSTEADFLASGALTCGAATQGKIKVHTTPLQYCDNAATPVLQYTAYADSSGNALAGDSATAFFSSGALEVSRGGTGSAPAGDDQLLVSDSTSAATWKTVNDCTGASKALTYVQSSNSFGCNTISAGSVEWSAITNPTTTLALTMDAAETSTFTCSSTTQTCFTWTSSTITSGMLEKMSITGSSAVASAASSGSVFTVTSSTTGFTGATQRLGAIYSTGANGTASVVLQGLDIDVRNTGTTNTNQALRLNASGGSTTNIALNVAAGELRLGGSAGTSGQVLASGGANTTPSWTTAVTTVQDEGSSLTASSTLNFTGKPVTCANSGGVNSCNFPTRRSYTASALGGGVATAPTATGAALATTGSLTGIANTTDGPRVAYRSGASSGNEGGFVATTNLGIDNNTQFKIRFSVSASTSVRTFIGIGGSTVASAVGSDNPAGDYCAIQYSTVRGDTNWQYITKDNTTQVVSDSGIAFSTSVTEFILQFAGANSCIFKIGSNAAVTKTANVPRAGQFLPIIGAAETQTGSARDFILYYYVVDIDN